ncbi:glycoside hydrolase family 88 protein, partial [Bacteroidota bacterium]
MAESIMERNPGVYYDWDYVTGTVLKGFHELWRLTNNEVYYNYIKNTVDDVVNDNGGIANYSLESYNIDEINEGRMLLFLYQQTGEEKYKKAADLIKSQLEAHPRTSEGGFWHKLRYPNQMWLDGLYMGSPFLAEYGKIFDIPDDIEDVLNQIFLIEKHLRDSSTGLFYHGWDESKEQDWADPITGLSETFWGRAMGWYAMAIVDALDYIPQNHESRDSVIHIMQRFAKAIKDYQDTSGVWWQVIDRGGDEGNYLESSVSCMFSYSLAKAVRLGYIDTMYKSVANKAYKSIISKFITSNTDGTIDINQICRSAGLGSGRDGSYDYYVYQAEISSNDGKATGPFILASLEMEYDLFPPFDLQGEVINKDSIQLSWRDHSMSEEGYILYKFKDDELIDEIILNSNSTTYFDTVFEPSSKYIYSIKTFSISDTSVNSNEVVVYTLGENGIPTQANNPTPVNNSIKVPVDIELSWNAGLGAVSHDIYFGTENPPPFDNNQIANNFKPNTIEYNTSYYWRIDEVNENGTTTGEIWRFETSVEPHLVGHWKFDEPDGNIVLDDSRYSNNGNLINMSNESRVIGSINSSLVFNGIDQYVHIPHSKDFNFNTNSFSISFWLKQSPNDLDSLKEFRYVIKGSHVKNDTINNSGARYEVFSNPQTNQLRFSIDDNIVKSRVTMDLDVVFTDDWIYIVAVRDTDNKELRIYKNRLLKARSSDETGDISQEEDLYFGYCEDIGSYLHGSLDDVRLYNYVLSNQEIDSLYSLKDQVDTSSTNAIDYDDNDVLRIYPNPANDYIYINSTEEINGLKIYLYD